MGVRRLALVLGCVVVCLSSVVLSVQVPVMRKAHKYYSASEAEAGFLTFHGRKQVGTTIPMGGGVLSLGAYYANITIGTPAQSFSLLIDTGSSNTVVPGLGCTTCGTTPQFNPKKSSTYTSWDCHSKACQICTPDGGTDNCVFGAPYCNSDGTCGFGISYGGGSSLLAGYWADEVLCFGGLCTTATFGMATAEYPPGSFSTEPFEGILGLASPFNACNPTCVTTIFDSYVEKQLVTNLYAMCITGSNGGIIDLGEIVPSRYTGEIQYAPQEVDRWFNLVLLDIRVGSTSLGLPPFAYATTNDVIGAFVDSGTSIVLFSPIIFGQIQTIFQTDCSLPGVCGNSSLFTGECYPASQIRPRISSYPDLVFEVKSVKTQNLILTLPATSYLMAVGNQYCLGMAGISGIGVVLGDLFMENYYIVFDRDHSQLGFAPIASCK